MINPRNVTAYTHTHAKSGLTYANDLGPYSTAYNIGAQIRGRHIGVKVEHPLPFPRVVNCFQTFSAVIVQLR